MTGVVNNLGNINASIDSVRPAIICADYVLGDTSISFHELDALANGIARALASRNYLRGDRIALLAANSPQYIAALLGIMRAGLVAVPINQRLPPALVANATADSGARLAFCDNAGRSVVPDGLEQVSLEAMCLLRFADLGSFQAFAPGIDDPAMILYTSGSTGKPKGIVLSHASQQWVVRTRLQMTPLMGERPLIAAPLYHMNALALSLLTLAASATAVLLPEFSPDAYIAAIQRHRCTWLTAVPSMMAMVLLRKRQLARIDLSHVRAVRLGSAPVSLGLLEQIQRLLPSAQVINAYGTTEVGPVVFGPHPLGLPNPSNSVGCAHPEVCVRLRDDAGNLGTSGTLEVRSPGLMKGYHNLNETALPLTTDGYFVTGDLFHCDADGFYTFAGRRDEMFVSGGENIYPREVEKVLELHPGVQQACVVPIKDEIRGFKPVAFVVRREGAHLSESELKAFVLENAAQYAHPRRVWFVKVLPLAEGNKIDRLALIRKATSLTEPVAVVNRRDLPK